MSTFNIIFSPGTKDDTNLQVIDFRRPGVILDQALGSAVAKNFRVFNGKEVTVVLDLQERFEFLLEWHSVKIAVRPFSTLDELTANIGVAVESLHDQIGESLRSETRPSRCETPPTLLFTHANISRDACKFNGIVSSKGLAMSLAWEGDKRVDYSGGTLTCQYAIDWNSDQFRRVSSRHSLMIATRP